MLERDIERLVTTYAEKLGWLSYKFVSPSNRSVPDRLYIKDGETIYIEFKQKGRRPTKLQAHTIAKIRSYGARVFEIDRVGAGYDLFDSFESA